MRPPPRVYSETEVREMFLRHVWEIIDEWEKIDRPTCREKISGAIFSLLAVLDGAAPHLPAFSVRPSPHPDDKQYRKSLGENWFPPSPIDRYTGDEPPDISGVLHELFYGMEPKP